MLSQDMGQAEAKDDAYASADTNNLQKQPQDIYKDVGTLGSHIKVKCEYGQQSPYGVYDNSLPSQDIGNPLHRPHRA